MFNQHHEGKMKNEKIMRRGLSCHLTALILCTAVKRKTYYQTHFSKQHALSLRKIHCLSSTTVTLIKATQLFERINIDSKSPLPSNNGNKYFLNIVGEYSRFPFVFPCSDVSTTTVIKCLTTLFVLFGMPAYVHSEGEALVHKPWAGSLFGGKRNCLKSNSQLQWTGWEIQWVVWKAVEMSLKSKNLHVKYWQYNLPDALHSIQSLLCTETKETLHECFFWFPWWSSSGASFPTWTATPGPVLLEHDVCLSW